MLLFLVLIFLVTQGNGQGPALDNYFLKKINSFRQSVAQGAAYMLGGHLPSTKSMFAVSMDNKLGLLASMIIFNCSEDQVVEKQIPAGSSLNYFRISNLPYSLNDTSVADIALALWEQEPLLYPIGDDATYNDTKLKYFANMVYYKTTRVGCAYKQCSSTSTMPTTQAIACVFNNAPALNQPLYIVSKSGAVNGCGADSDCSQYLPNAVCATSPTPAMQYGGLCYGTNVTVFPTSTTVTTSTTSAMTTTTTTSATTSTTSATTSTTSATTSTTTATTSTTTATTTPTTTTASFPSPMTELIRQNITNMHNYRRSRLAQGLVPNGKTGKMCPQGMNIYELGYSMSLENEAQNYADTCPQRGSPPSSRTSGENLAVVPTSIASSYNVAVYQAIKDFWQEIKVNANGINEAMVFTDYLKYKTLAPLRFTQMAWANTYQVGCGARLCGMNYVVVCRYNTRGNIIGENIYDVGPTCGECFDVCTKEYLYKGLCPSPY